MTTEVPETLGLNNGAQNMENELPKLIQQLIGRAVVFSLIHALFLRLATRWLVKVNLPFSKAYGYTVLIAIVGGLFMISFGFVLNQSELSYAVATLINTAIALVVTIILSSAIYATAIKTEGDRSVGIKKGVLISLVQIGLALALTVVFLASVLGISHLISKG